jgi:hypothetical protein
MREWSWFIGVWGKRPPAMPGTEKGAVKRRDADDNSDEDEEDDDRDVEKWWGFWEPEEIRKISGWIARTSGLAVDGKDTPSHELLPSQGLSPGEDQSVADADRGRPTRDGLKALVGRLEEYASVLEWRVRRQAGELDDGN